MNLLILRYIHLKSMQFRKAETLRFVYRYGSFLIDFFLAIFHKPVASRTYFISLQVQIVSVKQSSNIVFLCVNCIFLVRRLLDE